MDVPERTPDGHAQVWLLYSPEPFAFDSIEDRQINLWMRRCDVFTSRDEATAHLSRLLGRPVAFQPYDPLFPELWIFRENRGGALEHRWLMCPAPVNPPGGKIEHQHDWHEFRVEASGLKSYKCACQATRVGQP